MDVGVQINQYRVIEHIGRGGMADVWSARDERLNRMVAIKTIVHGLSSDVDPVGLFKREAQTIAQMEHPHILPIYDFGEYDGSLYIVMRYVTGGSLEDLLGDGPLSPDEALRMGQAIAQALDYAHTNKVIHLDLKPPNILLDSSNSPYLADFGLATVLDPQGRARNPGSGTLLYMAPEQLVAEVIDHRADIYSFAIMMFHMFAGRLPFDGTMPLALKQLQYQEELPDIHKINPEIPYQITDILRRGTWQEPGQRPNTLVELVDEMRAVLSDTISLAAMGEDFDAELMGFAGAPQIDTDDASLLEAVDLYSRARHVWAGGQGRFLLGVTHFMLMNGYYRDAEAYGLGIDEAGLQMLLRGALEYDQDIDHWWALLEDDNRRWVCLHAIRSGNAPARIRAFYRLETLPDDAKQPIIPRLVAAALQVETHPDAKIAALQVLGTRAKLMKPRQEYRLDTAYQGRLLTSFTRLGIQISTPSVWQDAVYSPEIDLLIAEEALDLSTPEVADFASRIIGRIRSTTAVRAIATAQREARPGALRALALIRDEAPSLPEVVSPQGRLYAWIANTARRLADRPYDTILRFVLALLAGWVAMGEQVYITFRAQALFTPQRWGNTIAIGLVFGLFVGLLVLLADQFSARLRGFWPWWVRALVFGLFGFLMGIVTWSGFTWLFLQLQPEWEFMRLAGFGLFIGFAMNALLNLRGWQAFLLTVFAVFLPLYAVFHNLYDTRTFTIAPVALLGLLPGLLAGGVARRQNNPQAAQEATGLRLPWLLGGGVLALAWALVVWLSYAFFFSRQTLLLRWDEITTVFIIATLFLLLGTLLVRGVRQWRLLTGTLAALLLAYVFLLPLLTTRLLVAAPQAGPFELLGRITAVQHTAPLLLVAAVATGVAAMFALTRQRRRWPAPAAILLVLVLFALTSLEPGQAVINWDTVLLMFGGNMLLGVVAGFLLSRTRRLAFAAAATAAFLTFYYLIVDMLLVVPFAPTASAAVLYYDFDKLHMIFTVAVPIAIVIALGGHAQSLLGDLMQAIGRPAIYRDRGGWLTSILVYAMAGSMLVSVLVLFSMHVEPFWLHLDLPLPLIGEYRLSIPTWTLFWVLWGLFTFVCAVATWQWKRWGARGLLLAGLWLVGGGFLFDAVHAITLIQAGREPPLFGPNIIFWAAWAVAVGVLVLGVLRGRLWGAMGLLVMLVVYIPAVLFADFGDPLVIFAITNFGLMAYALRPILQQMDTWMQEQVSPAPVPAPAVVPRAKMDTVAGGIAATMLDVAKLRETGAVDMATEFDVAQRVRDLEEARTDTDEVKRAGEPAAREAMATEMDLQAALGDVEMKTELDLSALKGDEPAREPAEPPRFRLDTSALSGGRDEMKTELDVSGLKPADEGMRTEMDVSGLLGGEEEKPPTEPPRIKLDTTALDKGRDLKTELDVSGLLGDEGLRTEMDLSGLKPADEGMRTEMDISGLLGDKEEKPPTEPPRIRLDTTALDKGRDLKTELDVSGLKPADEGMRTELDLSGLKPSDEGMCTEMDLSSFRPAAPDAEEEEPGEDEEKDKDDK